MLDFRLTRSDTSVCRSQSMASSQIQRVFVLMLENRSFDSLLGFSGMSGTDAVTGERPRK
jgi:phospholipase C